MTAKTETIDSNPFATLNAIQVRIDENVRMMAELHARWEREDEIARNKEITKVFTITTTSSAETPNVRKPPIINNKRFSKEKASTPPKNCLKLLSLTLIEVLKFLGK